MIGGDAIFSDRRDLRAARWANRPIPPRAEIWHDAAMSLTPFATLFTSSIPLSLSVWRIEEAPTALPVTVPAAPASAKPAAAATARMVSPGSYAVSISRAGAAYAEC